MKISISYEAYETLAARTVEEFCLAIFPGIRVHKSERHPPFLHTYLDTKKARNPHEQPKKA